MGFIFRPAIREEVGLLVFLAGPSGSGKTFSAMRLAQGIVGPNERFAVIDTEARRALHYADQFKFDHGEIHPPFRPDSYAEAIKAADQAGYKAIVVDSVSHEWSGEGGILDWAEEELTRMAGSDWKKREACKLASFIRPKTEHKKMVSKLLQVKASLILCFRAEERVKMEKQTDEQGKTKTVIVPIGWQPICEKNLPYEATVSFLLTPDAPGMPKPLKLQEQHRALFPLDKPINEESGRKVAEWAKGGAKKAADEKPESPKPELSAANKPLLADVIATITDMDKMNHSKHLENWMKKFNKDGLWALMDEGEQEKIKAAYKEMMDALLKQEGK